MGNLHDTRRSYGRLGVRTFTKRIELSKFGVLLWRSIYNNSRVNMSISLTPCLVNLLDGSRYLNSHLDPKIKFLRLADHLNTPLLVIRFPVESRNLFYAIPFLKPCQVLRPIYSEQSNPVKFPSPKNPLQSLTDH